jgi:hypothetical protein
MDFEYALEKLLKYDNDIRAGPSLDPDPAKAAIRVQALSDLVKLRGEKVFYGTAPQGTLAPYQTINLISDPKLDKRITVPKPRYQFSSFATDRRKAKYMADLLYPALAGFGGIIGGTEGVIIDHIAYDDQSDSYDQNAQFHYFITDFIIQYRI